MPRVRYLKCYNGNHVPLEGSLLCQCGLTYYVEKKDAEFLNESDLINSPNHYIQGIECWDYIISQNLNYLEGNIIKYITRYKKKNGLEDLRKAKAYLEKLISTVETRDDV